MVYKCKTICRNNNLQHAHGLSRRFLLYQDAIRIYLLTEKALERKAWQKYSRANKSITPQPYAHHNSHQYSSSLEFKSFTELSAFFEIFWMDRTGTDGTDGRWVHVEGVEVGRRSPGKISNQLEQHMSLCQNRFACPPKPERNLVPETIFYTHTHTCTPSICLLR